MSMILSGQRNICFIHIPRTSGTSIKHWMVDNMGDSKFVTYADAPSYYETQRRYVGTLPWSFSIVRNPWDRTVSLWTYLKSFYDEPTWRDGKIPGGLIGENLAFINELFSKSPSFEEVIKVLFNDDHVKALSEQFNMITKPKWWHTFGTPFSQWTTGVDYIVKYENFNDEFQVVRNLMECSFEIPCIKRAFHRRTHSDYRLYYNTNTRNIVAKAFATDIDMYKYVF